MDINWLWLAGAGLGTTVLTLWSHLKNTFELKDCPFLIDEFVFERKCILKAQELFWSKNEQD